MEAMMKMIASMLTGSTCFDIQGEKIITVRVGVDTLAASKKRGKLHLHCLAGRSKFAQSHDSFRTPKSAQTGGLAGGLGSVLGGAENRSSEVRDLDLVRSVRWPFRLRS